MPSDRDGLDKRLYIKVIPSQQNIHTLSVGPVRPPIQSIKVKVKITLEQATKTQKESKGIGPGTHFIGGWVGPRAVLDGCGISLHRPGFNSRSPW
jgi:hypothetical protein